MKYLYHATATKNTDSILNEGIKPGLDGVVYFADSEMNALSFMMLRFESQLTVFQIDCEKLNETLITESYDHSELFFKCKAWMYPELVKNEAIVTYNDYARS